MYQKHFHPYIPSVATNIMARFESMGWIKPSQDPAILAKWKYYQSCAWRQENAK